jgi:hypothetical protein
MPTKSKTTKAKTAAANKAIATPADEGKSPTMNADQADGSTTEGAVATAHVSEGTPAEEVADRSADVEADVSVVHEKEFVLGPGNYSAANGYNHDANKSATRQYMIAAGLRPVGDVEHVSTRTHLDGKSKVLKYRVTAVPAHLATDPDVAHAEVVQGTGDTSIQPDTSQTGAE